MDGDALTRWSIRVALTLCVVALAALPWRARRISRACWTLGWLFFAAHVSLAFHHYHDWSHTEAIAHVERRSGFGPGLFFSYLLALLWTGDVVWWAISPSHHARRPTWVGGLLYGYFLFMAFNATVVYETGVVRVAGIVGTASLLLSACLVWLTADRMRRNK